LGVGGRPAVLLGCSAARRPSVSPRGLLRL